MVKHLLLTNRTGIVWRLFPLFFQYKEQGQL